ncbi:LacI family DNA-binding transcriptional regulator [Pseudonocardia autotrophica]|uniref:LacI family DNA-binding transcriptional regulator n=2 Tax=Pseudonocardia TaxID=1847 RepID=UPI0013024C48|nr:LacI family DNA-binding transcriptional regulator [Pseudonocardia autotrophica]
MARAAGTSTAVVSYVLNEGSRPISAATREKVLRAIEEVGYRPNGVARALASGSTRTLGLVVPELANQFFATLAHALEAEASKYGLVLLLGDSAESVARERELVDTFVARQVDGLIYVGVGPHDAVQAATSAGLAVVVLDRTTDDERTASVVIDNVGGARAATEHLLGHGRRRLGALLGPRDVPTSRARRTGWLDALTAHGVPADEGHVRWAAFSRAGGYRAGLELLRTDPAPDAVFVASEDQALGLLCAAAELGVAVPGDLAVASFDGTDASRFSVPPLTTVAPRFDEIARRTIELLRAGASTPGAEICASDLVIRASCGCPWPTGADTVPPPSTDER